MLASHRWLCELAGVKATPDEVAVHLTRLGLEVEAIEAFGHGLEHVVIAEVRAVERVPDKDKLSLVTVFDGEAERKVICGAPNVPEPGGRVVLAKPGACLPGGLEIAERRVGGVVSSGMLCSEVELAIGSAESGILVLTGVDRGKPGQLVAEGLRLEDHVYEIGVTPNRPDCLGHIGLARELALAVGEPFRAPNPGFPSHVIAGQSDATDGLHVVDEVHRKTATLTLVNPRPGIPVRVAVELDDPSRCPRYAAGVVQGVTIKPSPFRIRYRLHVLGIRAIDCVVDVTNLVLLELGHPIHAFDLSRVRGEKIVVRQAKAGEVMATLDGIERTFVEDDLLICDGEGPIAIAGVMGGGDSEITPDTKNVLIEVAYFAPRSIRRTSRRLGLHTESSHRFERGVDPGGVPWAMRRAVALLAGLAEGAAAPIASDQYPAPIREKQIELAPGAISGLLGADIPDSESRRALEAIGCLISPGVESGWRVTAPTWRPDLSRPEDLVEEVGRIWGYDNIEAVVPQIVPSGKGVAPGLAVMRKLRESAAAIGLLEAVNYAFVSPLDHERARSNPDALTVINPLSEERSVMRTSLLPGLLADTGRALRHQARTVALFEIGRTYHATPEHSIVEPVTLAVILAGVRSTHVGDDGPLDFYDLKGRVASILEASHGIAIETRSDDALDRDAPFLHPRRRARVFAQDRPIGVLGELHPDLLDAHDIGERAQYCEIALAELCAVLSERGEPQAEELPRFPAVIRDLAIVVPESLPAAEVERALTDAGRPLASRVELFDVYRGPGITQGHKSLAYRIVYRDPERTLTDKQVEKAHRGVVSAATRKLGAAVRQ